MSKNRLFLFDVWRRLQGRETASPPKLNGKRKTQQLTNKVIQYTNKFSSSNKNISEN